MRLVRSAILTLVLAGLPLALLAAPAGAAPAAAPELTAVRCAHHPGFDRVTFQFRGGQPSSRSIRYVSSLTEDPSGRPVHLAAGAILQVVFHGLNAHDLDTGRSTVTSTCSSPGLPSLKQVAPAGDFEAVVTYGLGVDHRVPFKVLQLSNPPRLAIDLSTASAGSSGTGTGPGGSSGALPFTGDRSASLLLTGLGLAATGALVLVLARKTRTP